MQCKTRALGAAPKAQFRLIRAFTPEHNLQRLKVFVNRLGHKAEAKRFGLRYRVKSRRALRIGKGSA